MLILFIINRVLNMNNTSPFYFLGIFTPLTRFALPVSFPP
nr:MAG TPA: hypothetical protein [Caudoviricetes sp.]